MEINEKTFDAALSELRLLGWNGPVYLSCDDTKLLPAFRLYYDKDDKSHYLVGGTEGRLKVVDPEQVEHIVSTEKAKRATKVRQFNFHIATLSEFSARFAFGA